MEAQLVTCLRAHYTAFCVCWTVVDPMNAEEKLVGVLIWKAEVLMIVHQSSS